MFSFKIALLIGWLIFFSLRAVPWYAVESRLNSRFSLD